MIEAWRSPAFKDLGDNEEPAKILKNTLSVELHTHTHIHTYTHC